MYDYPWLVGTVMLLPYTFGTEDLDKCNGQTLPVNNSDLFKYIGTQFGGDGKTDFGLPDLRDAEPIKGISYCIAVKGTTPQ